MAKNTSTYAIFKNRIEIDRAIQRLESAGFRRTDISVLFPENSGTKDLAIQRKTKAPEGTVWGTIIGAIVGGFLSWMNVDVTTTVLPGTGFLVIPAPLASWLAGVAIGGLIGGVIGAIAGATIPEYEAKRFVGMTRDAGILLSVHCDDANWAKRAREVLESVGGDSIASSLEASASVEGTEHRKPRLREGGETTARRIG